MEAEVETMQVLNALKIMLKSQKVTYAELAKRTGTTEAAVKNIFYSRSVSLEKLIQICQAINVSFSDLIAASETTKSSDLQLSEANEKFFVEHPNYLAFFRELVLLRKPPKKIKTENNLDQKSLFIYLRQLEKMELIEIVSDSNIRHKVSGRLTWRKNGPWFQRKFFDRVKEKAKAVADNLASPDHYLSYGAFSLPMSEVKHFFYELDQLVERYQQMAFRRSLSLNESERKKEKFLGWNFMVTPYPHPGDTGMIPRVTSLPNKSS